jgi:hypothetical protein
MTDSHRCEPLTVRDQCSRYVLAIQAMTTTKTAAVKSEFEKVFDLYGLPKVIRSDNGSPFASVQAPLGLTRLSVWWLTLGIDLDRIEPGHPEQNGGHERMHRDIRTELQGQIGGGLRDHQAVFDVWRHEFNHQRPHEALQMRVPADLYRKSTTRYSSSVGELQYPGNMVQRRVNKNGRVKLNGQAHFLSLALVGTTVGLQWIPASRRWSIWLNHLRLGELDLECAAMIWSAP